MESTRRYSGFVCPDCRAVFRVPHDYDGQGVVCPCCRRVLKIPSSPDQTQALVIPFPVVTESLPATANQGLQRKSRRNDTHDWDRPDSEIPASPQRDRQQMLWTLMGGGVFLVLAIAAVFLVMRDNTLPVTPIPKQATALVSKAPVFSETAFLAEAEPLAKRFLEARTIDDLLPLVRHPEITEPRIRAFYPDGKISPVGISAFNTAEELVPVGSGFTVQIRTGEYFLKSMGLFPTSDGIKIDWESWVGWSEMPWADFIKSRPTEAKLFRVILSPVNYYNFNFTDEGKWRSYQVVSPDNEHTLYAYAELFSELDTQLRPSPDQKQILMTVSLKFPPDSSSPNQVLVEKWHANGWVLENEIKP